jgi:SpoIID/LytB domain protein
MDDYVAGIAEMPTRWPLEALKAQAVAARTYAWRAIERGVYSGYDICATVACQVFRGAEVVLGSETGHRWRQAVDDTAGEVLLGDDDRPILARYFSTSGGRTYANEDVFPSNGSFDYLVGIDDPYDAASPLHRWHVTFTRDQFDEILSRGQTLSAATPVASVERIGDVDDPLTRIRVNGVNGVSVDVGVVAFRDFVSRVSASLYPEEFPGLRDDGEQTLPATMPSSRFSVTLTDDDVFIAGRGWGHGVGMGQFGALGRAEAGADYTQILAAYYNGLIPQTASDVPERVRVGMSVSLPMRLRATTVFDIVSGDARVVEHALGTWDVERVDGVWQLTAPVGHDAELEVSPTRLAEGVATFDDVAIVDVDVNKPVFLRLVVTDADGQTVHDRTLGVVDAGEHRATWRHNDDDSRSVPPGEYAVSLVATDASGVQAGTPISVTVPEPPPPPPPPPSAAPQESDTEQSLSTPLVVALAIGVAGVLLVLLSLLFRGRR